MSEIGRLADDLMKGADEIGEFVFGDDPHRGRKIYHAYEKGYLKSIFKLGGVLCARRSRISQDIADLEHGSANGEAA